MILYVFDSVERNITERYKQSIDIFKGINIYRCYYMQEFLQESWYFMRSCYSQVVYFPVIFSTINPSKAITFDAGQISPYK
jgi:hypothetical protein